MIFIVLLIILSSVTSLCSMNNDHKNNLFCKFIMELPDKNSSSYFNPNNVNHLKDIIDKAERSKNAPLMARLISLCLPPDLIKIHINSHFSKPLTQKYQYELIKDTTFNRTILTKNNQQWLTCFYHDGTYCVTPKTYFKYSLWKENQQSKRFTKTINQSEYTFELQDHTHNTKTPPLITLYSYTINNNKLFLFQCIDYSFSKTFNNPIQHYALNYDSSLLAIEDPDKQGLMILNTRLQKNNIHYDIASTSGNVTALCAAHKASLFAIGSDHAYDKNKGNLTIIFSTELLSIDIHKNPIIQAEFSPDDTRLLTASYDPINNQSLICLSVIDRLKKTHVSCKTIKRNNKVINTFFISHGERIVVIKNSGHFDLLNGYNNTLIGYNYLGLPRSNEKYKPSMIWSNKNNILISAYKDQIRLYSALTAQLIKAYAFLDYTGIINGIGLTSDEKTLIVAATDDTIYQLDFYSDSDYQEINFIQEKANLVQLYTIEQIFQKKTDVSTSSDLVDTIKSYIKHQQ